MSSRLLAISPLDGRYFNKVSKISKIASEFGLIKYRIKVEIEWLKLLFTIPQLKLPALTDSEIEILDKLVDNFDNSACNRVKEIESIINHDVKAVEYYIKEQMVDYAKLNKYREFVHFACTSEDINNLSYALMLKDLRANVLMPKLVQLQNKIRKISEEYRSISMVCRTHGQIASPSTMGKEFYNVYYRLQRQLNQFVNQEILGKINGAVGNYNAHFVSYPDVEWNKISKVFVEEKLGLVFNPYTTQIEPHDYLAEIFDNIRRINTILIDFSRDLWGYISINYFTQKITTLEIGSSTMPHKVNPIDFENSEGNLGLANSLAMHLSQKLPISRWQRDLTDSTVLRNIGTVIGYTLLGVTSCLNGLDKLEINVPALEKDLENSWEILAEPIQIIMRKHGITDAYEQLKKLSRGHKLKAADINEFIHGLAISEVDRIRLLNLTPKNYIGLANKLF